MKTNQNRQSNLRQIQVKIRAQKPHQDMNRIFAATFLLLLILMATFILASNAYAHGEKAQQAGLRMRTLNWFDTEIYPREMSVNDNLTIKGKFMPSEHWPRHMASITDTAFLNVGVPGPAFIRVNSNVNGTPMIRSTSFELGKIYEYEINLKARIPGRYHVHPIINVKGAGPIIGPAFWVNVGGDQANFVNTATTLDGTVIDMETYGLNASIWLHVFWVIFGLAWIAYWFRNMRKDPVIMPRFKKVKMLGPERADELITRRETLMGMIVLGAMLTIITGGFFLTQQVVPQTIPLQTGWIPIEPIENPTTNEVIKIKVGESTYRIPGRSFQVEMTITNNTPRPIQIGEFMTANIRFINSQVQTVIAEDTHHLIASDALRVEGGPILPGETKTIKMIAEDALWESERLTSLVYDPDSFFAGMIFFFDDEGNRYYREIGGTMFPTFI
ncbi:MAG TPA: methane monooxygenase/ammonia monooxygenase subunit B [Gammaproteobacteria bacterium]|nr:methane monooxygenase/ammonia monooxygenase subunit B [Gammaproteobacteria bacterium]